MERKNTNIQLSTAQDLINRIAKSNA
ncbi:hypothetical protein D910_09499 [Dendroctonus ponderosae]|uniref:Uncharacterized protein n=2 Tax=Dendroctonus ponderosae TaxID=77166 RepID=U4UDX8_DENPD|nr:hypothetical protein D910_09499 [Dendroctonus ponderosae]